MRILLLFTLLMGAPAHAKNECYELLLFSGAAPIYFSGDVDSAQEWMQEHFGGNSPAGFNEYLLQNGLNERTISFEDRNVWLGKFALSQWQRLSSINHKQRMAALSAELKKLSKSNGEGVQTFSGRAELDDLSAANLQRLLKRLDELHPIEKSEAKRAAGLIKEWNLKFHHLTAHSGVLAQSVNPPVVSAHEMERLGISDKEPDYFSDFVGGSYTVAFELSATDQKGGLYNLGSHVAKSSLRLNDAFAAENGFYIPKFTNVLSLLNFMEEWEPAAMEEQLRFMKFSLPSEIDNLKALREYLSPEKLEVYFPRHILYHRGAVLRRYLRHFVLNAADGETFYRAAFQRFLVVASRYEYRIEDLKEAWQRPRGAQKIWSGPFMEFLGFDGVDIRIPSSVPPTQYSIIRKEPVPGRSHDETVNRQPSWDSRRLDHRMEP